MKVDYIALSIPIFFLLIGIELLHALITKRELYRFNDAITNISLGIGQQIIGIFLKTVLFFGYLYLYNHFRYWTVASTILNWILLFIAVDFFYYWFHRMSHEINAMWAAHIVHHQSEEYNLSVALRQSWFQSAFSWVFYLPLALIGFDPIMFLTISSFNTLYQFWIHTRAIRRMGLFEWFLNTPSHHRVHHGSNPKYLDKNHGGTLIIWDRLFGTFQKEEEEVLYGITKPLESWNPVWANFHYWMELFSLARKTPSIGNKVKLFVKSPGWRPLEMGGKEYPKEIDLARYSKYNSHPQQKNWNLYVLFLFVVCLSISTLLLFKQTQMNFLQLTFGATFSLFTLINCGGILENKSWIKVAEFSRILFLPLGSLLFFSQPYFQLIWISSSLISLISFAHFLYLLRSTSEIKQHE